MDKEAKRREMDGFWDIERLVPRRTRHVPSPSVPPLVTVDVAPGGQADRGASAERRLTSPAGECEEYTYTPKENPLLLSVTVRRTVGGYSFYEQFKREAVRLFDKEGGEAPYVAFFSYAPQYNQLTSEQMAYYLYLRSEIRAGRYPRADRGYLFLLVFEIVCLPEELLPHTRGAELLAALWGEYRASVTGLDRYMIPFLTDYCLIHALPCPPLTPECLSAAAEGEGAEFFFGNAGEGSEEGVLRFLHLSSDYRLEGSRALTDENRAAFTCHVTRAMAAVLPHLLANGLIVKGDEPRVLRRRAFAGTLCAHNVRAEYELSYHSIRYGENLRKTVGLAVKYAENRLRAAFGIRARLSAAALPETLRAVIDGYFDGVIEELSPKREEAPPAYMKLYEAKSTGIDPALAKRLEEESWALTRRLVEDVSSEEEEPSPDADAPPLNEEEALPPCPAPVPPAEPPASPTSAHTEDLTMAALSAFLCGGDAPRLAAEAAHMPLALLAERLNEEALLYLGDVLVAPLGDHFVLIEDYREEATEWLKINRK